MCRPDGSNADASTYADACVGHASRNGGTSRNGFTYPVGNNVADQRADHATRG